MRSIQLASRSDLDGEHQFSERTNPPATRCVPDSCLRCQQTTVQSSSVNLHFLNHHNNHDHNSIRKRGPCRALRERRSVSILALYLLLTSSFVSAASEPTALEKQRDWFRSSSLLENRDARPGSVLARKEQQKGEFRLLKQRFLDSEAKRQFLFAITGESPSLAPGENERLERENKEKKAVLKEKKAEVERLRVEIGEMAKDNEQSEWLSGGEEGNRGTSTWHTGSLADKQNTPSCPKRSRRYRSSRRRLTVWSWSSRG